MLAMGILPQLPVYVTNMFSQYDADGVAWKGKAPSGNSANHSVYLGGWDYVSGLWRPRMINDWDLSWGPFGDGTARIPLDAIDNPAMADDGWGHAVTIEPQDSAPGAP